MSSCAAASSRSASSNRPSATSASVWLPNGLQGSAQTPIVSLPANGPVPGVNKVMAWCSRPVRVRPSPTTACRLEGGPPVPLPVPAPSGGPEGAGTASITARGP